MKNIEKYKKDLESLIALGDLVILELCQSITAEKNKNNEIEKLNKKTKKEIEGNFENKYQRWYTESCAIIKQLIPDRLLEFEQLYKGDGKRKVINTETYNVQDWLLGLRSGIILEKKQFNDFGVALSKYMMQLEILKSIKSRFESTLFDIRQLIQADLFDSELDAAKEIIKHGFLRGAGVISGVILEKHLSQVSLNHNIKSRKKSPSISEYNDLLKNNGILDTPSWRHIQRLGDIRNICAHNKLREPTKEEVEELISGVEKFTKTLF